MSFLVVFEKVGAVALRVLGIADSVAQAVTPLLLPSLSPEAVAIEQEVQKGIVIAELAIQAAESAAAAKKASAFTIASSALPALPPEAQQALSAAIDNRVALNNNLAILAQATRGK